MNDVYKKIYERGHKRILAFEFEKALQYYRQMMAIYGSQESEEYNTRIYWDMGKCEEQMQHYEQAIDYYEQALKLWCQIPESGKRHIFFSIANAAFRCGKFEKAFEHYSVAQIMFHRFQESRWEAECEYGIACVHLKLQQIPQATAILQRIFTLDPSMKNLAKNDIAIASFITQPDIEALLK